jgi:putative RNA 2'-phosphotransferase
MHSEKTLISTSKFLSLLLRHAPETIGLKLDEKGWARIDDIIRLSGSQGRALSYELIEQVVVNNDKKRFVISEDGLTIRASQGHSITDIDLEMKSLQPPALLFHGTATRFLNSIREGGLIPGARNHVHLSKEKETAMRVGSRHGSPVVLIIEALSMHGKGFAFYQSENSVWLTEHVPTAFITFPD